MAGGLCDALVAWSLCTVQPMFTMRHNETHDCWAWGVSKKRRCTTVNMVNTPHRSLP